MGPVVAGYLVCFYLLWLTLSLGMPVGIAYGVWTACGVALVAVIARYLFSEPLTWLMVLGIGLIVAGVLTIEMAGAVHCAHRTLPSPLRPRREPKADRPAGSSRPRRRRQAAVRRGSPRASATSPPSARYQRACQAVGRRRAWRPVSASQHQSPRRRTRRSFLVRWETPARRPSRRR